MLHVLPAEVTLIVLSYLPIPSLLSLAVLSRQWVHFFATQQSEIFRRAAIYHEYIPPGTMSLEGALSMKTGKPWAGSASWKDFCYRSFHFYKNWEGKGRAVARVLLPPGSNPHHIKVDEKTGICITTRLWGGIVVTHLFSGTILWCLPLSAVRSRSRCEYENGYLVFDNNGGEQEVWRLSSDFASHGEVAATSRPNDEQMATSAHAAAVYRHYAPRGHFRAWALLRPPEPLFTYRLAFPTLICANLDHAFLYDVRTCSLMQTINIHLRTLYCVDVNERHAFVCEPDAVHVFSLESGIEILRIPVDATLQCSQRVQDPCLVSGDWFITTLFVTPKVDECLRSEFIAAHVSRDGRDLVILSKQHHVVFIRDFERICRGETTFERAGLVLSISPEDICHYLDFEHGRVCAATIFMLVSVFVRPSESPSERSRPISCMQLTDGRIYFTWGDYKRRMDIPRFEDAENAQELSSPPTTPVMDPAFEVPPIMGIWVGQHGPFESNSLGCIDFTLMPEGYASEI
ncbi:hypothetical protein V8E53_010353 [Lactarius tabidus]